MADEKDKREYVYKGYDPRNSKYVQKYNKEHYKYVSTALTQDIYNNVLKPLCDSLGMSVSSFIKESIMEKIERENSKSRKDCD